MTKFIVIASGKGGTGKTTTAINLGIALTNFGRNVILLEGNLSTPHLGLHLGSHNHSATLTDVLNGKKSIRDVIYLHHSGLKIIPAGVTLKDLEKVDAVTYRNAIKDLMGLSEIVIIDSAAGLGNEAMAALEPADGMLIVTNPELPAITDALKMKRLAERNNVVVLGIILNRVRNDELEMTISSVETILETKVIGAIPEDDEVRKALNLHHPVTETSPDSGAAKEFRNIAAKLIGNEHETHIQRMEKEVK